MTAAAPGWRPRRRAWKRTGQKGKRTGIILGRRTAATVTALGTGVDGAVRRIDSAYDTLGRLTTVTARNGVTATSTAVNQVTREYNGFGQLTSEWQAHTGLVSTTTTPRVQKSASAEKDRHNPGRRSRAPPRPATQPEKDRHNHGLRPPGSRPGPLRHDARHDLRLRQKGQA